ncbi:MAG: helix-turn-helix domain-containing protein [Methylobacter sp.]|nr:helix-turn-helix domain-containing protein [Methylobacter sp.]
MSNPSYSTNTNHQQKVILTHLQSGPLTTHYARTELDVMHPAARVQELKAAGHNIITYRTTVDTGKATHKKVACYVLLAGCACDG